MYIPLLNERQEGGGESERERQGEREKEIVGGWERRGGEWEMEAEGRLGTDGNERMEGTEEERDDDDAEDRESESDSRSSREESRSECQRAGGDGGEGEGEEGVMERDREKRSLETLAQVSVSEA